MVDVLDGQCSGFMLDGRSVVGVGGFSDRYPISKGSWGREGHTEYKSLL